MTGQQFKDFIDNYLKYRSLKGEVLEYKDVAKMLGISKQNLNGKFKGKSLDSIFEDQVKKIFTINDPAFTALGDEETIYKTSNQDKKGTVIDKWGEIIAIAVQPKKLKKLKQKRLDLLQQIDELMKRLDEDISNEND